MLGEASPKEFLDVATRLRTLVATPLCAQEAHRIDEKPRKEGDPEISDGISRIRAVQTAPAVNAMVTPSAPKMLRVIGLTSDVKLPEVQSEYRCKIAFVYT